MNILWIGKIDRRADADISSNHYGAKRRSISNRAIRAGKRAFRPASLAGLRNLEDDGPDEYSGPHGKPTDVRPVELEILAEPWIAQSARAVRVYHSPRVTSKEYDLTGSRSGVCITDQTPPGSRLDALDGDPRRPAVWRE